MSLVNNLYCVFQIPTVAAIFKIKIIQKEIAKRIFWNSTSTYSLRFYYANTYFPNFIFPLGSPFFANCPDENILRLPFAIQK